MSCYKICHQVSTGYFVIDIFYLPHCVLTYGKYQPTEVAQTYYDKKKRKIYPFENEFKGNVWSAKKPKFE